MQIDWLTVGAQIVNFLVLVWLLKRFLYGPITRAMERREARIAEGLHEAERKRTEAEAEAQRYHDLQQELEDRRADLMTQAHADADAELQALQHAARDDVAARKAEWLKQLNAEHAEFLRELRERAVAQFYGLARRALADLADTELEDQIARVFIARLETLTPEAKRPLADAACKQGNAFIVRSGFELPAATKRRLTTAVHESVLDAATVTYEVSDHIACGLELRAGHQTLSWTLGSYLDTLEKQIVETVGRVAPASE
jgi:F-type H+-transporting ATPase subunit b